MLNVTGRFRLLTAGMVCALAMTALMAGAFVVEARVPTKKPLHGIGFVAAQKRLIVRKLARPHLAFAAKPAFKPAPAKPAARPPTQQQILAARIRTLPKTAFRAPLAKPPVAARPPVKVALARPAPYRPALVVPQGEPVSLTPATQTPQTIAPRPDGPELLARKSDWSVFRAISGDSRTCFAATRPKDSSPRLANRKQPFLYLTTYAPGDVRNEVTFKLGMPLEPGSNVVAVIDGRNYRLAASGDMAYPKDIGGQRAMLDGLKRGSSLTLRTALADAPAGGAPIMTDAFSLLGLAAAMKASDEACIDPTGRR